MSYYNMYPESSLWMSRTERDNREHRSAEFGGLGHVTDYGTEFDTNTYERMKHEQAQRPVSTQVAELVTRSSVHVVEG